MEARVASATFPSFPRPAINSSQVSIVAAWTVLMIFKTLIIIIRHNIRPSFLRHAVPTWRGDYNLIAFHMSFVLG
jgi:hypothetical protein